MKRFLVSLFLTLALAYGMLQVSRSTTFQLFGDIVHRVETEERVIALTLDDGPSPHHVDEVLEILAERDVKATFFLVGVAIEAFPETVRKIADAGHEIANHSFTHPRMILMRPARVRREIEDTDAALEALGIDGPNIFRPPFGKKLVTLPWYLAKHDRTSIMWDIYPEHWEGPIEDRVDRVRAEAKPGSIILLHVMFKFSQGSRDMLGPMIDGLHEDGYRFVTMSELLASGA